VLTYSRLFDHIVDTVKALNKMGIGRGDRVAIVLPNGPEAATAFLAVACCATCAPLNPGYKLAEFKFYLSDLDAKSVITLAGLDSPVVRAAQNLGIPIIELIPDAEAGAGVFSLKTADTDDTNEDGFSQPKDEALVLHTSGTTARPKMVPLTHENLCASALSIAASLELDSSDRCLNVMPLFHIHGLVGALLASFVAGSSIVCTRGFDADNFISHLDEFCPTWYTGVPTMHQEALSQAREHIKTFENSSLRFIRSCSAALPPKVMSEMEDVFGVPVIEAYGMTEASHQISVNPLPPSERKPGSVGVANGPEVAIMDEAGNILKAGLTGEIVIRGGCVTQGYHNNPAANEDAFSSGYFRTGDEGHIDTDGYIFITGRIKEMINRGGEKIAPREVDEVLLKHAAVIEVVAFAVPHEKLGEEVAAVVVLAKGMEVTEDDIRSHAREFLADFKVPVRVLIVDSIPKGPTGKTRRIGLADKFKELLESEYEAPRTFLEGALAGIWEQVLGVVRIGINDNFFLSGGDSLQATRVTSRIRSVLGANLPLTTIFSSPTIAALSLIVLSEQAHAAGDKVVTRMLAELEAMSEEEAKRLALGKMDGATSTLYPKGRVKEVQKNAESSA
jgi:acyl-CoA synthetase (AMP-forming)/AMP-acid ligase II